MVRWLGFYDIFKHANSGYVMSERVQSLLVELFPQLK